MEYYFWYLVGLVAVFLAAHFLLKPHLLRFMQAAVAVIVLTAVATAGGFFDIFAKTKEWNPNDVLTLHFYSALLMYMVAMLIFMHDEKRARREEVREKQWVKEFRGTVTVRNPFIVLQEYPGFFFECLSATAGAGDGAITKVGDKVLLKADTDPNKRYYHQSLRMFSDGSRPLPIMEFRNLNIFPEMGSD